MSSQREIAERLGLAVHPPKVELFDLRARTNTDPKQYVRKVEEYRLESCGLYMARPVPDHLRITYIESWLLPELGLRVTRWKWHRGHERDQDFYLDVTDIETGENRWRTVDHYLDIEVCEGRAARLLDVDEFLLAVQERLLDTATAQRAMETACATIDGLARHGYSLAEWLSGNGITLSWRTP